MARFPSEGKTLDAFGLNTSTLKSVAIPNDLREWPLTALNNCVNLEAITVYGEEVDEGTLTLSYQHNLEKLEKLEVMQIPSTVIKTIGTHQGDAEYKTIAPYSIRFFLPSRNIISFGTCSFICHQKLNNINYSKCKALTEIDWGAFDATKSTTSLDLSQCNTLPSIGDYAFLGAGISTVILPPSVKVIKDRAFRYCGKLTTFIWRGEKASSIASTAFTGSPIQNEIILHQTT